MSESVVAADGYVSGESSKVTDDPISSELEKFSIQSPMHMDIEGHQDKLDDDDDDEHEYEDEDVDDDGHVLSFLYFSDSITYEEDIRHGKQLCKYTTKDGREVYHVYLELDESCGPSDCKEILKECGCSELAFLRCSRRRNTIFYAILDKKQAAALEAHDKVAAICPARDIMRQC